MKLNGQYSDFLYLEKDRYLQGKGVKITCRFFSLQVCFKLITTTEFSIMQNKTEEEK